MIPYNMYRRGVQFNEFILFQDNTSFLTLEGDDAYLIQVFAIRTTFLMGVIPVSAVFAPGRARTAEARASNLPTPAMSPSPGQSGAWVEAAIVGSLLRTMSNADATAGERAFICCGSSARKKNT